MAFYGYCRIVAAIRLKGLEVDEKRVLRLMHEMR